MQLGKASAAIDLGLCGDNDGDNISAKNRWYGEHTALYWLWKNSDAQIKGLMHYRRLLDLLSPNEKHRRVFLEDIVDPDNFVKGLGLTTENVLRTMENVDVITQTKEDNFFKGSVYEHFACNHIKEHIDWVVEIIKIDFPQFYPVVKKCLDGNGMYFQNLCIMKAEHFDTMCKFCFAILDKLEKMVDVKRPEIANGWRYTSRYAGFIGERITSFFIEILRSQGKKILEYGRVDIVVKGTDSYSNANYYCVDAYSTKNSESIEFDPVFDKNAVAIMMATNNKYAAYCGVMLQSIIEHANPSRNYDIVIAVSDVSENNKRLLELMSTTNVSVRAINCNKLLQRHAEKLFTREHFTVDMYQRLFIPELFAQYDKVLYLDSDMVALRDIADLFDIDIGNNWWGAARELLIPTLGFVSGTYEQKTLLPYIKETLQMDDVLNYFNSGVMIWNVSQCIKDKIQEGLIRKLAKIKEPFFPDQDIINSLANGKHIHWISNAWNVAWNPPFHWTAGMHTIPYQMAVFLLEDPFILHYCGVVKPWLAASSPNANYFWQYARKTPFYEKLLMEFIEKNNRNGEIRADNSNQIKNYKAKAEKYKLLQGVTFGVITAFTRRKNEYRKKIEALGM
jgi:lipopolysaccharide biosynthesis glycosyltransferase